MIDSTMRLLLEKFHPNDPRLAEVDSNEALIQKAVDVLNVLAEQTKTSAQKSLVQGYVAKLLENPKDDTTTAIQKSAYNYTDEQIAGFFDGINMADIAKAIRARVIKRGNK